MADRDIPSVPITTLAGLTSLSDLLSELPISESSATALLNKSLLFHPRVAQEANNLLSVKDDNLTRQLVHAIEQTNSDHIELKSQYAEQQTSGTNINELPQLLQAIHTHKPTVFKSGGPQYQQRIARSTHPQVLPQQQQQQNPYQSNTMQPNAFYATESNQQTQQIWNPQCPSQASTSSFQHQSPVIIQQTQQPGTVRQNQQQQLQQQQMHLLPQQSSSMPMPMVDVNNVIVKQEYPSSTIPPIQSNVMQYMPQQQQQHQQLPNALNQQFMQNAVEQQHEKPQMRSLRSSNTIQSQPVMQSSDGLQMPMQTTAFQHSNPIPVNQFPVQQHQQSAVLNVQNVMNPTTIQPNTVFHHQQQQQQQQQQPQMQLQQQQQFPTQQQLQFQQQRIVVQPNSVPANNQSNMINQAQISNVASNHVENHVLGIGGNNNSFHENNVQPPKMVPRNNEYLERQSKISDIRGGPSPAQASDAPESNQLHTPFRQHQLSNAPAKPPIVAAVQTVNSLQQMTSSDSQHLQPSHNNLSSLNAEPVVRRSTVKLLKMTPMEISAMTTDSIKDFKFHYPERAVKLGIVRNSGDTFAKMKADEVKTTKRRLPDREDEIVQFSQPKVRRVEKIVQNTKSTKEDVMKSQVYLQFIRNMENEVRRFEETEQPSTIDDIDYYSDCISSKMLTQLTNDVAKLKAKGAIDFLPKNELTLLINFAMRNIDVARNLSAGPDMDEDSDELIEKILDATEACLFISNIYATAIDVKFLLEDNMDKIVKFVQFQMRETIFPSYDPVFSVKSMKKDNRKKKSVGISRKVQLLFNKLVELTKIFVTLFDKCQFVDTIVLAVSSLAVEPFFVDNIETLQFACLELVTTIFRKATYIKYRSSILNDILSSVDRLPCSKKNLRPYKLMHNGGSIQMVTALVLQLVQCSSVLPNSWKDLKANRKRKLEVDDPVNKDLLIMEKYDQAVNIGGNFLTTFLNKCRTRSGESDFRPLFENFIHDLLTTVNKPEWPASELLLYLLSRLLVKYMSDKNSDQAIRVVSLEYLGLVAARLRKDTVESRCKVNTMDALIKSIKLEQEKEGDTNDNDSNIVVDPDEERTEFLQIILLDFLAVNAEEDNLIYDYARHFYLVQWYKDVIDRKKKVAEGQTGYASRKVKTKKHHRRIRSDSEDSNSDDDFDDDDVKIVSKSKTTDQELNREIFNKLEQRKAYFLSKVSPSASGVITDIKTYIDYSNAHLITQYLASKKLFMQSFQQFLNKILVVIVDTSIAIRTKAIKCLANIVEVDPSILQDKILHMGVGQKLLDPSISVREAAVDLVGKYVLSSSDLIDQYYDMLAERILDTGVSVRKRVIRIMRDICIEYPDFDKIPEICVKMIRRVNDEEMIQKLVTDVFMRMWFMPCPDNDKPAIERKINQIIEVVSLAHDTGTHWLDGLLRQIFEPKEDKEATNQPKKDPPPEVIKACQQLADGLVNETIRLDGLDNIEKLLSCVTTISLLAKVRPALLVKHAITLEPYLNLKSNDPQMSKFIASIADILESVVPLMEHPSESFLADLESHLMYRVVYHNHVVVNSCLSCLGSVVNKISKNYKLIRDCYVGYCKPVRDIRKKLESDPNTPLDEIFTFSFRRALFTTGLIFRYFDFKSPEVYGDGLGTKSELPPTICTDVFEQLFFFSYLQHNGIRRESLAALGHFCVKNSEYLVDQRLRNYYCEILRSDMHPNELKVTVLRNIINYLTDADAAMSSRDKDWKTQSALENLCDMNDRESGMSSRIIQLYLADVSKCLLHINVSVRMWSMKLVEAVLRQGLIHPNPVVPYLMALATDTHVETAHRAESHLNEISKKHLQCIHPNAQFGIERSYQLQQILQHAAGKKVVRGYCIKPKDDLPTSVNGYLYSLIRVTKPNRRSFVSTIIKKQFEESLELEKMLFMADNLAYFPFSVQDEIFYIIYHIDQLIAGLGNNVLDAFRENLLPAAQFDEHGNPISKEDMEDYETKEILLQRLPEDTTELQKSIISSQACILLLLLKQHFKTMYRINDIKISQYLPSELAKVYEKAVHRQTGPAFNPKIFIDFILEDKDVGRTLSDNEKHQLIDRYLEFKQMMDQIEKEETYSDSDTAVTPKKTPIKNAEGDVGTPVPVQIDFEAELNNVNNVILTNNSHVLPNKTISQTNYRYPSAPTSTTPSKTQSSRTNKTPRKTQTPRVKRKKKRVKSSSEEEDDYSDDDYYA